MIFEKHLKPVWLVLIEKLSLSTLMSTHLPGFQSFFIYLHHLVLAKLTTSAIKVNPYAACGLFDQYEIMQKT